MPHREDRRHYRVPCNVPALLNFANGSHVTTVIVDLTVYGACLRAEKLQPAKGQEVRLSFIANGVQVEVVGVITWGDGADLFGVRFTDVAPLHQLHIASYLYARMQMLGFRPGGRW